MLGLTAVLADGRVVNVGGRVVKNVAGYDMTKLFVGSWGTLGVIASAHLREIEAGEAPPPPEYEDPHQLAHTYLRPSQAEENRKKA